MVICILLALRCCAFTKENPTETNATKKLRMIPKIRPPADDDFHLQLKYELRLEYKIAFSIPGNAHVVHH